MITAKDTINDRIIGLDIDADDYIEKPFNYGELAARIKEALRRGNSQGIEKIKYKELVLDGERRCVWRGDDEIELSRQEFDPLELLMINQDIVVTKERIFSKILGDEDYLNLNILAVYIKCLRDKVDRNYKEKYIKTIRGIGYSIK